MMDSQDFTQPSWPFYNIINSSFDQVGDDQYYGLMQIDDSHVNAYEFSSPFSTPEDSSDISSIPCFSTIFPTEFAQSSSSSDDHFQPILSVEDFLLDTQDFEPNLPNSDGEMEFIYRQLSDSELSSEGKDGWSPTPSIKSSEASLAAATPLSLMLPGEESELNSQLSVHHLLKAYGEAMEKKQSDLADVIMRCVSEKVSLSGEPLMRLAFNLSKQDNHGDYLKQEASKNFETAFKAFYQIFPYGRFAHFGANSAILEAMPPETETIHIVDFDIGEGVQWPPMIEALASLNKEVKLTTVKWEMEIWCFEEAKRRLIDHARMFGLKLKVEEMGIEDLVSEIKRRKKRGGKKEWLAFNCMVGLPHMGRVRSRKLVDEFLRVAKELMGSNKGIIIFGDGDGDSWESYRNFSGFGSFFEGNMMKYQALLESIESNFPVHLADARMALECLFVAPYISSHVWFQRWMDIKEGCNFEMGSSLEGWGISRERLEEGREMVKGKGGCYGVRIGGHGNSEMILEWKGTPLLRISAWRN